MELKVCKNCRRLFKYIYGPELCQDCVNLASEEKNDNINKQETTLIRTIVKEDKTKYEQVKDYIMAYPNATVAQISEAIDIPPTKLFEWIKDDRLEFSENSEYAWFTCEKCGAKIKSGRLCNRCKTR